MIKNNNPRFEFIETSIKGLFVIKNKVFSDERGYLKKDYEMDAFHFLSSKKLSLSETFYTQSKKNTIRAHHFQYRFPQAKIINIVSGKIWDVVVDLRKNSPTYKKYESFLLSEDEFIGLFIPKGMSHGYFVIEDSIVSYKCSGKFYQKYDFGIKWNDETINVKWPFDSNNTKLIISEKDMNLPSFKEFEKINNFK